MKSVVPKTPEFKCVNFEWVDTTRKREQNLRKQSFHLDLQSNKQKTNMN